MATATSRTGHRLCLRNGKSTNAAYGSHSPVSRLKTFSVGPRLSTKEEPPERQGHHEVAAPQARQPGDREHDERIPQERFEPAEPDVYPRREGREHPGVKRRRPPVGMNIPAKIGGPRARRAGSGNSTTERCQ